MVRTVGPFPIAIVDKERAQTVCLLGQGVRCCRWLALGPTGHMCLKHDLSLNKAVQDRFERGEMGAQGDNCEGLWPT